MLKPRSEAATVGIHKVSHAEEFWRLLDGLGDSALGAAPLVRGYDYGRAAAPLAAATTGL